MLLTVSKMETRFPNRTKYGGKSIVGTEVDLVSTTSTSQSEAETDSGTPLVETDVSNLEKRSESKMGKKRIIA